MRGLLIACGVLLLAGCAQRAQEVYQAEQARQIEEYRAEYDRRMATVPPLSPEEMDAARARAREVASAFQRDQQAAAICAARAEMAGATYSGRGAGLVGALTAGTEAAIASERVRAACLRAYQATGVLPSY